MTNTTALAARSGPEPPHGERDQQERRGSREPRRSARRRRDLRGSRAETVRAIVVCRGELHRAERVFEPDAVQMRVPHGESRQLKQESVDRVLRELALDLTEQLVPPRRVDGVVESGDQRLEVRIRVAEIIVVARVNIVVHGLDVGHDAHVEIMARENLVEPLRPLEVLDAHANTDRGKLRGGDLARAACIARRRQLERDREAPRVTRLRQQGARARHIVRIHPREVDIIGAVRREVAADRDGVAEHGTVDQRAAVESERDRAPHRQQAERRPPVVEREKSLGLGAAHEHLEARIRRELRDILRRRIGRERIDIARHERGIRRGWIGDELEYRPAETRPPAPVVIVAFEDQRIAAPPLDEAKRAGADRSRRIARGGARLDHDEGAPGERLQQAAGAAAERQTQRERIERLNGADRGDPGALRIQRVGLERALERILGRVRIEADSVVKAHPIAQMKRVRQAIGRNIPGGGEARPHGTVARELHQPLEQIAVQSFRDRRGRIRCRIEHGGLELYADGHGFRGASGRQSATRPEQHERSGA
jgi:hypothetical protein